MGKVVLAAMLVAVPVGRAVKAGKPVFAVLVTAVAGAVAVDMSAV